ncbi:Oxysterol-binding protein-domain-containing protein, partial [Lineolata rhizophorae]
QSYLVRWINVPAGHTISWSIQPHKKSVNFGIFKHPGGASSLAPTPNLPAVPWAADASPSTPNPDPASAAATVAAAKVPKGASRNDTTRVVEKLQGIGLKSVAWTGKCEADKVSMGRYDVPEGEGGMYALVFDNTFSKQVSKTATFVLMTYPTSAPPKSGHHLHFSQATASSTSLAAVAAHDSTDSLPSLNNKTVLADPRPRSASATETKGPTGATFYTGVLRKKRRKRNQGFARRFFSLDFTSSTLSYYRDRHSSALRGAIPLSLAAVSANEKTREISVDSGAEVWHLRASNQRDFYAWLGALERASLSASSSTEAGAAPDRSRPAKLPPTNPAEESEWTRVEALVGRVAGTRDAVRRLAKDTDPKYLALPPPTSSGASPSPTESDQGEYFKDEKVPFWKRKPSGSGASPSGSLFRRSVSAQLAVPAPAGVPPVPPVPTAAGGGLAVPKQRHGFHHHHRHGEDGVHDHCMAILRDLDAVVAEFSALVSESRARRHPVPPTPGAASRKSMDSASSDEFFDAQDRSLLLRRDSEGEEAEGEGEGEEEDESESGSSSEDEAPALRRRTTTEMEQTLYPARSKNLAPLPLERPVPRRTTVPPARVSPPSLIGFLRKNVGKDLATIAMPVSANEPLSLLQRVAEQLEYAPLLTAAAGVAPASAERLLHVAAFAVSSFSSSRVRERAVRKPFNPMLGETFELVREDAGFRFLAEKVSHRPVRIACTAEHARWSWAMAPAPSQKFWGKSAELNTDGRARIAFHDETPGEVPEHYSYTLATSFLRNIIAGEKYVEPVNTMTVTHDGTAAKAVATFKAGGMFAGRSEEVVVEAYGPDGGLLPLGLAGKWTSHLNLTRNGADAGRAVWKAGPLVDQPEKRYGFTAFAAQLNEVTDAERGRLPPTDSRLRPDQRALEDGDVDRAEALKARLEERQRGRRRVMDEHGAEWRPRWFDPVDDDVWRLKRDGYWEERARGDFTNVVDVLSV